MIVMCTPCAHHDCRRARRDVLECCGSSSNVFDYVRSEKKKTGKSAYFTGKINYVVSDDPSFGSLPGPATAACFVVVGPDPCLLERRTQALDVALRLCRVTT